MPLTDTKIRILKPREKAYKLADEKGLFLLIKPNGGKYWRFKYRFAGKEKLLAIGTYPELSLRDARDKRDDARKLLVNGTDPGFAKKVAKRSVNLSAENSFESIAREWFVKFSNKWTPNHGQRILIRLEKDIFPGLSNRPINEITAPEL